MAATYTSREGDTVDSIAFGYYGSLVGRVVERVLEANPGLADRGAALPYGVVVALPDLPKPASVQGVRLWD